MGTSENPNGTFQFQAYLDALKKVDTSNGVKFIHKFLIPAPDTLSSPTQLYVGSPRQICDVGKDATVLVRVYGWSRKTKGNSFQNHALEEIL
ncbi:MAG: hypothetical protein HY885_07640 [Deltaproteobacteria bacterium]|nr:hypothetical protein [Deltaproteobacteria bacterium]